MKGLGHYIKTFKSLLRIHGFAKDGFFTYHYRPKKAEKVLNYMPESMPNVCIVIQGPIKKEDNFTIETIKLYKKYYRKTPIVVSTWDTESEEDLNIIKQLCGDDNVCISHFEKDCSVNYQRTTSSAGVAKATEIGCRYVLKTRTDQRIYQSRILSSFIKLMHDYPILIKCSAKGRIISCGLSTFSDRLYNVSDMMIFGFTEDVQRYFSCPKDTRDYAKFEDIVYHNHEQYWADYSKLRTGEIWYTTHYIESLGFELKWTKADSDYFRNELYVIIDDAMLDLYWDKYTNKEYRWRNYETKESLHQVSFMEWWINQKD